MLFFNSSLNLDTCKLMKNLAYRFLNKLLYCNGEVSVIKLNRLFLNMAPMTSNEDKSRNVSDVVSETLFSLFPVHVE